VTQNYHYFTKYWYFEWWWGYSPEITTF